MPTDDLGPAPPVEGLDGTAVTARFNAETERSLAGTTTRAQQVLDGSG